MDKDRGYFVGGQPRSAATWHAAHQQARAMKTTRKLIVFDVIIVT
jgi:hypothetical protein